MRKIRQRLDRLLSNPKAHKAEGLCHACYFAGVAIEGHGFYPWLAGALAIFTVFTLVSGGETEE